MTGVVKLGAESLGSNNPDSQVMLMNAVKDVASALGELIQATKAASGKPIDDPSMGQLKGSARVIYFCNCCKLYIENVYFILKCFELCINKDYYFIGNGNKCNIIVKNR